MKQSEIRTSLGAAIVHGGGHYKGQVKRTEFRTLDNRIPEGLENEPHGNGQCSWLDGTEYKGYWQDGLPSGPGRMTIPSGEVYDGEWQGGFRHGFGRWWSADRQTEYAGEWESGLFHGTGELRMPGGRGYWGQFKKGQRHGLGVGLWSEGYVYIGDFEEDCRHGNAMEILPEDQMRVRVDSYYETERLVSRQPVDISRGFLIYSTDGRKVGREIGGLPVAFEEGEDPARSRPIKSELTNGAVFLGQTRLKAADGRGNMTFWGAQIPASGETSYQGQFKLNAKHGIGEQKWGDEKEFVGIWIEDRICGPGVMKYADGSKHEGEFVRGELHGFGIKTFPDGSSTLARFFGGLEDGEVWNFPAGTFDPEAEIPNFDLRTVSGTKSFFSKGQPIKGQNSGAPLLDICSGDSLKQLAVRAAQRGRAAAGLTKWEPAFVDHTE